MISMNEKNYVIPVKILNENPELLHQLLDLDKAATIRRAAELATIPEFISLVEKMEAISRQWDKLSDIVDGLSAVDAKTLPDSIQSAVKQLEDVVKGIAFALTDEDGMDAHTIAENALILARSK